MIQLVLPADPSCPILEIVWAIIMGHQFGYGCTDRYQELNELYVSSFNC